MGKWKPLLPFGGSTILQTVVGTALRACSRVVLVTGCRGAELAACFAGEPGVLIVPNEGWERGMFSSVQIGVARVQTTRFFVTLGDMPWIASAAYEALWEAAVAGAEADAVFPVFGGRRGHPVLFHGRIREAVAAADPSTASMRLIAERLRAVELPWPDDSVIRDIDTPGDLE